MVDNQTLLAQYFDTAFAAPDGIKRLRELILSLAMRGKLVPQNPKDQPASELLREIEAEKKRLIEEKKIKPSKALPQITPEEIPYDLPESWEWVRLGDIALQITDGVHKTPKYINSGIPFISIKDIDGRTVSFENCKYISEEEHKQINSRCNPEKGDILICRIGTLGRATIVDTKLSFSLFVSVGLLKFPQEFILPAFTHKVLHSPLLIKQYDEIKAGGSHTNKLNLGDIPKLLFPLPPLEEQKRIVEKIDRLFEQVDRLEQLRSQQEQKRLIVHAAASYKLLHPQDEPEFKHAWRFIQNNFGHLYAVKENVSELRKAILQLAVMGKLVPQDPTDPPASELLKEIEAEKQRLLKEGKIKKQKPLPEITPEEIPYQIPNNWLYTTMDNLFIITGGIQKTSKRTPINNHYPYLGVANVQRGYFNLDVIKRFELVDGELEKYALQKYDLLIVEGNGSPNEIGRCAIWNNEIDSCVHQNHLIRCRPINKETTNYILMVLNSPLGIKEMQKLAVTTSGLYTLSVSKIRGIHLLLPPLPEQHRIVEKVDRLMNLCDELEANIEQRTAKQTSLLNAVMAAVSNE